MIRIPPSVLREIYDHGEESYPNECCGLLVGQLSGEQVVVQSSRRCRNLNTERARDRYLMDPLCMLKLDLELQGTPWIIVGVYHSHPDHPSRASQTDTERALEIVEGGLDVRYSYLIVSVREGTVAGAQSWVLNKVERKFDEEPLLTEGDSQ